MLVLDGGPMRSPSLQRDEATSYEFADRINTMREGSGGPSTTDSVTDGELYLLPRCARGPRPRRAEGLRCCHHCFGQRDCQSCHSDNAL